MIRWIEVAMLTDGSTHCALKKTESITVIETVIPEIGAVQAGRSPKSTATIKASTPHHGPLNPPPQGARLLLLGGFVAGQPLHMFIDFLREPQLLLGAQACAQ